MYDILFKCAQCEVHLSADADDVGYEFLCPQCDNILRVPSGEVLFECDQCGQSLLGSKQGMGDTYTCPQCECAVIIPAEGRAIPTRPVETSPVVPPPPKSKQKQEQPAAVESPDNVGGAAKRQEDHLMMTWGGYMVQADVAKPKRPGDEEPERTRRSSLPREAEVPETDRSQGPAETER